MGFTGYIVHAVRPVSLLLFPPFPKPSRSRTTRSFLPLAEVFRFLLGLASLFPQALSHPPPPIITIPSLLPLLKPVLSVSSIPEGTLTPLLFSDLPKTIAFLPKTPCMGASPRQAVATRPCPLTTGL